VSTEEALLRAIQEAPDDDLHRQVLADWLDDQGDTVRAEFIRLQLELARGVADAAQRARMQQREKELLYDHADDWLGPFANTDPPVWRYERGTARVRMHTLPLLQQRARLLTAEWFPRGWVLDLCVHGDALEPAQLFEQPWLGQLHRLALEQVPLGYEGMTALTGCTALARLSTLSLTRTAGVRGDVARLAHCPNLEMLTGLGLCDNGLTTADIADLSTGLPRLRRLNLSSNPLPREHVEALLGLERLKDLVSLQVAGCILTSDMVELLVSSQRLAGLEELNLNRNHVAWRGGKAIAASPHLANLRRLGLRKAALHSAATDLARSPYLNRIDMLDTWDSQVGRGGLGKLHKRFGEALWRSIAEPPCWTM
jgi:uncharacterized protein (TIGR02996 family)